MDQWMGDPFRGEQNKSQDGQNDLQLLGAFLF